MLREDSSICHICSETGDGELPGDAEGTAHDVHWCREGKWYGSTAGSLEELEGAGCAWKLCARLVKDTYEDARTQVKTRVGVTGKITVRVGLHQGSSPSRYLFDLMLDVMWRGIKEQPPPRSMLFANDIVLCCSRREQLEWKVGTWRRAT